MMNVDELEAINDVCRQSGVLRGTTLLYGRQGKIEGSARTKQACWLTTYPTGWKV